MTEANEINKTETKTENVSIVKEFHRSFYHLYKRSDGIIKAVTSDTASITMKEARDFVAALKEFTGGIPHPFLYLPGRHLDINKEARSFMASEEGMKYTKALAIVMQSIIHRVIGNLFITVDRPQKPVRHFENENDAITWLKIISP